MCINDTFRQYTEFFSIFLYVCRTVYKFLSVFHRHISEKCHYDSEGVQDYPPRKGGMESMEQSQELIGILQAISIVAKSLAAKLMQIEKEVEAYEAAKAAHGGKMKKGWRR